MLFLIFYLIYGIVKYTISVINSEMISQHLPLGSYNYAIFKNVIFSQLSNYSLIWGFFATKSFSLVNEVRVRRRANQLIISEILFAIF